ncbi:TadE/TadG family type IV pilus assembly protein [Paragemmobacter straminiformis]|uniref:Flp pilus assembly protein TadG n=1 Tax=Paragemmobacter straminiformis TaxID=2045119 RepID=A0A842HZR8_9RHOB|nr:hypothetical protein [Gemmobacter straminiformis]MBC2834002.1 hypothetical protein [Gemmobacter straminiformis]
MTGKISRFDPRQRLGGFLSGEGGSAIVEGVVWLPVLLFAWLTVFGFWDVYRERATVQKATFVAADLLSREMVPVDTAYLDGLGRLIDRLSDKNMTVTKRYTLYRRNGSNDSELSVIWSYAPNAGTPRDGAQLQSIASSLPKIRQGETAILVETSATYAKTLTRPFESLVLGGTMETRVVLRPRFFPTVCLNAVSC